MSWPVEWSCVEGMQWSSKAAAMRANRPNTTRYTKGYTIEEPCHCDEYCICRLLGLEYFLYLFYLDS